MTKTCKDCSFSANPDNAHYCGNCGKSFDRYYSTGKPYQRWKVYDANSYELVSNFQMKKYRELEKKANDSFFKKAWESIADFWKDFRGNNGSVFLI